MSVRKKKTMATITTIQRDNDQQIFARMSTQVTDSYSDHNNRVQQPESSLFENLLILGSYLLLVSTFPISLFMCFKVRFFFIHTLLLLTIVSPFFFLLIYDFSTSSWLDCPRI